MTYVVRTEDVDGRITVSEIIDVLEEMFYEMGAGRAITNSREDVLSPVADPDRYDVEGSPPIYHGLKSMGGVIPAFEVGAVRINSDIIAWSLLDGKHVRDKIPAANGRYTGLILVFSTVTGEPLAILPDGLLQSYRVAGTSALGVKYLANERIDRVGLLGAGHQARAHALAIDAVRSFDELVVFSPTPASREEFAQEITTKIAAEVIPASSPKTVFEGADVVQCATSATSSVVELEWIEPGTHLGCIRQFEPPPSFWDPDQFDIFAQSWTPVDQIEEFVGVNERVLPTKNVNNYVIGGPEPVPKFQNRRKAPICDWKKITSMGDIVYRGTPTRESEDEVTIFFNRGMGIQFAAVGKALLDWCERTEVEIHSLPTRWLTQPYRP